MKSIMHWFVCSLLFISAPNRRKLNIIVMAVKFYFYCCFKGFSFGQFAFWRDEAGKPRTQRDSNGNPPRNSNG